MEPYDTKTFKESSAVPQWQDQYNKFDKFDT